MGLLLRSWLVFCPFDIVLPGLLVSFPLGGFLTGVMFVSWLLMVLLVIGSLEVMGFVVFRSLTLLVVLVFLVRAGFWEALKEFDSTEKHQQEEKILRVSEARWCSLCGSHVLHECDHSDDGSSLDDRVGVGLVVGVALTHVPRLCMYGCSN